MTPSNPRPKINATPPRPSPAVLALARQLGEILADRYLAEEAARSGQDSRDQVTSRA